MSDQEVAGYVPEPWYRWHRFALVPTWHYRPANYQNTFSFHFHWLCFRLWTIDSPDLSAEVTLDDMGLQIRWRIPYVIMGLFIPLFPMRWHQKLWRKSAWSAEIDKRAKMAS